MLPDIKTNCYNKSEVTRERKPSQTRHQPQQRHQLQQQQQPQLLLQQLQQQPKAVYPLMTMTTLRTRLEDSKVQHQERTAGTMRVLTITFVRTRTEFWTTTVKQGVRISAPGGLMRWLISEMSCLSLLKLNSGDSHIVAFSGEAKLSLSSVGPDWACF